MKNKSRNAIKKSRNKSRNAYHVRRTKNGGTDEDAKREQQVAQHFCLQW
jgi:hypothetical protein